MSLYVSLSVSLSVSCCPVSSTGVTTSFVTTAAACAGACGVGADAQPPARRCLARGLPRADIARGAVVVASATAASTTSGCSTALWIPCEFDPMPGNGTRATPPDARADVQDCAVARGRDLRVSHSAVGGVCVCVADERDGVFKARCVPPNALHAALSTLVIVFCVVVVCGVALFVGRLRF